MQMSRRESGRPLWEARAGRNGGERKGGSLEEIDARALVRCSLGFELEILEWGSMAQPARRAPDGMVPNGSGAEPSPQSAGRGGSRAKSWAGTAAGRRGWLRTTDARARLQAPDRVSRSTPGALAEEGRKSGGRTTPARGLSEYEDHRAELPAVRALPTALRAV